MASEVVRNTMAFVIGEGDEQKRVEIDDSEIAQTEYADCVDGPRSDLTVTIGPADRAALLTALLEAEGMEKRWALVESKWGHVHSRAWFDTPEKVDQYRRDTGINGRCRPIYVPKEPTDA